MLLSRLLALITLSLAALLPTLAHAGQDFLDPEDAFSLQVAMPDTKTIDVHFRIAPGYYLYRERFDIQADPGNASSFLGQATYPAGLVKYDPTFEKDLEVYHDQVTIRVPLNTPVTTPFSLRITSQGCADAGLCYPPAEHEIRVMPTIQGATIQGEYVTDKVPPPTDYQAPASVSSASNAGASPLSGTDGSGSVLDLGDTDFAAYLASAGWLKIIALSALLGVLLSFTPCVLPMVPILLAIVAGGNVAKGQVSRWRGVSLAAVFVLGMSIVYTVLGVAAGLVGASLAAWLQTPWVLAVFAILLALLALAMFDVFTLQAPGQMQSALNERMQRLPGGRYGAVFLMGMLSALIVGPCVAAPLAGVLLFISQTGDVVLGGSALFAMAWGEGLLLLVVGASSGVLLPRAGAWMNGVKQFFGVLLLGTAWWMVNSIVPGWLAVCGWAALAFWSASLLGTFRASTTDAGAGQHFLKATGLMLAVWATLMLVGLAGGGHSMTQPLAPYTGGPVLGGAQGSNPVAQVKSRFVKVGSVQELDTLLATTDKPVMLDFYADWCVSCIEMEKFTFSDSTVASQMQNLLLVQADVTQNTADDRALLKRFNLFGPPGIIFFDASGKELSSPRVIGFMKAADFSAQLKRVLSP
jgi:thiol:disulfide interchange protein DsbD